jgi:hypothetical protein
MPEQSESLFPPLWRVEQIEGGYVIKDTNGRSLAYVYGRKTLEADADTTHVLTMDEARHIASNIAKLPTLLTLREASAFILKTIAIAGLVIIAAALAAHIASHYIAR